MNIEDEFQKHMIPLLAEGYQLNPSEFERIRLLTHLLYENHFAATEMTKLLATKPILFDKNNFHDSFAHFYLAIVTHARCFMSAGEGISRLDEKSVFANEPILKAHHVLMMKFRNEVIAHTDHSLAVRVTLAVKEEPKRYGIKHFVTPTMPGRNDLEAFLAVINHTGDHIIRRVNRDLDYLGNKLGKVIELVEDIDVINYRE